MSVTAIFYHTQSITFITTVAAKLDAFLHYAILQPVCASCDPQVVQFAYITTGNVSIGRL